VPSSPREPVIVGVSLPYAARHLPDMTSQQVTRDAVLAALDDAGLDKSEVNGACIKWDGPGPNAGRSAVWVVELGPAARRHA
jgi:hypothetical protein